MPQQIEVGVLGATGMVGQHFVRFLQGHPWFKLTWVGASDRSAGKKYSEATAWRLEGAMPQDIADLTVQACEPSTTAPPLIFSAMDASVATEIERAFAAAGHVVVSNSRNHRMEPDVPLLVPEINHSHLSVLPKQKEARGWKGYIVTNPNCSTIVMTLGLAPLMPFGIERIVATTLQAISGAGYPGVASMDINANVVPFIGGEEAKMESETQKILGSLNGKGFEPLAARVSAHCNRVPVVDGHMVCISVELKQKAGVDELRRAFDAYTSKPQQLGLPSAPARPVIYMEQADRPQPRRDVERENGMAVFVGRLRECPVFDYKFIACGHNTVRGAAGAAVLNAELMLAEGLIG
ncbi:MAG TPA: aspartate-semialdehyde dehydrogenase [Bryobacteraceae bacterium]|nr:aspartate-semialdehyde dehydrogenase [Bryobacteraceae bacterium]